MVRIAWYPFYKNLYGSEKIIPGFKSDSFGSKFPDDHAIAAMNTPIPPPSYFCVFLSVT